MHVAFAWANLDRGTELLQRFRTSLSGKLPEPGPGGILMAACNDLYYERFGRSLLQSIELQGERQRIHLHLYQPGEAVLAEMASLQQQCQSAIITWTIDPCLLMERLPNPIIYFATARFWLAHVLLEEVGSPLLCIDVDSMAIRPLWPPYESLRQSGDIGLIFRPKAKLPWRRILASAVGFNPTTAGRNYCSVVARAMADLLVRYRPAYHLDQVVLHHAARSTRSNDQVSFFDIPLTFSDYKFDPASVIWTAKGGRKEADAFQQRQQANNQIFQCPPTDHT